MTDLVLAVALLACVGVLVWRAIDDRRERQHLLHLLVAKTPAEAVYLDRATTSIAASNAVVEREKREYQPEMEDVGLRPIGT